MLSPFPGAGHQFVLTVIEDATDLVVVLLERLGDRLPIQLNQFRFVIDQVKRRRASILKQKDDLLRPGGNVRQTFGQGIQWIDRCPLLRCRTSFFCQQRCQRNTAKSASGSLKKVSTIKVVKLHNGLEMTDQLIDIHKFVQIQYCSGKVAQCKQFRSIRGSIHSMLICMASEQIQADRFFFRVG